MLMNTYDYENELFRIDPKLKTLRDLKEIYVQFNERNAGKPLEAEQELAKIIHRYAFSGEKIFEDFAVLLQKYHDPIINSFIMVEKYGPGGIYDSRMSNGPIESLNRKVKDLKRLGRGFRNFDHFRNIFLYATRNNPILNATKSTDSNYYYYEEDWYITYLQRKVWRMPDLFTISFTDPNERPQKTLGNPNKVWRSSICYIFYNI